MTWQEEKARRETAARETHARLSRFFREDRFAFERERKRLIEDVINSVDDEGMRLRLRALQDSWDRKMKGAGSPHNRFVLARTFFWEHFHEAWQPSLEEFRRLLDGK